MDPLSPTKTHFPAAWRRTTQTTSSPKTRTTAHIQSTPPAHVGLILVFVRRPQVFYLFGVPGILVFFYLWLCMPETRGKSKDAITQDMLQGRWVHLW